MGEASLTVVSTVSRRIGYTRPMVRRRYSELVRRAREACQRARAFPEGSAEGWERADTAELAVSREASDDGRDVPRWDGHRWVTGERRGR